MATKKKTVKVRDMKPVKDAKGGFRAELGGTSRTNRPATGNLPAVQRPGRAQ